MTTHSFRFVDDDLNLRLIALIKRSGVAHAVGKNGVVRYPARSEDVVENELICSVRDAVFPSWQVLSCPSQWVDRYKSYMTRRHVPFVEELGDNQLWFLIPRRYRPHSWKLDDPGHVRAGRRRGGSNVAIG